jgi:anti-sigma B factor antagonist
LDELARIELGDDGPDRVVRVSGEIDISNALEVERRLLELANGADFVLDPSRLSYLDSAGVRLLFHLAEAAPSRLRLVLGESSPLGRVLELAGAGGLLSWDGLQAGESPSERSVRGRLAS